MVLCGFISLSLDGILTYSFERIGRDTWSLRMKTKLF
jgi:hypothetical protein